MKNISQLDLSTASIGITPKKSLVTLDVQRRRNEIDKSEKAAFWALFNTSIATLLYYDLCYFGILGEISSILTYLEWLICAVFATSAFYDFLIHFWPRTFMKPLIINPNEKKLLGIQEDELGFKICETQQEKLEKVFNNLPPFDIDHSFKEDKIVQPSERIQKVMKSTREHWS